MTHKLDNLPKWAQNRIKVLEADLDTTRRDLEFLLTSEPTNTGFGIAPGSGAPEGYLKQDERVTFCLKDARRPRDRSIQVWVGKDNRLEINAIESLDIRPRASNTCTIGIIED